ncbi:MAG: F0F1 ATP synthase subunit alpha [Oscillospiraceae bacterium]|nr:F0F1 ATP synthase subunit alpha [Oscillospiraceae bacterium]
MDTVRSDYLKSKLNNFSVAPLTYQYGEVVAVGDGVARVSGLSGRLYGELLEFENGVYGMALDLQENGVGAVLFDSADSICVGDSVKGTGRVTEIPVGDKLLGRVIDPIGRPLDGKPLDSDEYLPAERKAPTIIERRPIDTSLETGILAIDSMVPIGRGQRELIIGDRQTGKTTIAIDTIVNQKKSDVLCVYCAIGQKASNISYVIETLKKSGALDYTVVVAATASDSPATQYIAPYCACSIAEYFMEKGKDVLIVYDDLSKHAVAYRAMSLLLHRPPGREAYPGDVFYLHSRLLERSACLSKEKGGGSLTALPIIETMGGNISAYIPTNVISITDGQIFLESELFHSGIRPAVNTGLSVSRVGRSAQQKAMKKFSGTLRIELSLYREMAVFTRFGSDVDASTKKLLRRGESLTELLKQGKSEPRSLFTEVSLLLAHKLDAFENVSTKNVKKTAKELLEYLDENCISIKDQVNDTGDLTDSAEKELADAINKFKERL